MKAKIVIVCKGIILLKSSKEVKIDHSKKFMRIYWLEDFLWKKEQIQKFPAKLSL